MAGNTFYFFFGTVLGTPRSSTDSWVPSPPLLTGPPSPHHTSKKVNLKFRGELSLVQSKSVSSVSDRAETRRVGLTDTQIYSTNISWALWYVGHHTVHGLYATNLLSYRCSWSKWIGQNPKSMIAMDLPVNNFRSESLTFLSQCKVTEVYSWVTWNFYLQSTETWILQTSF